jgi:hypothetical protein
MITAPGLVGCTSKYAWEMVLDSCVTACWPTLKPGSGPLRFTNRQKSEAQGQTRTASEDSW